MELTALATAIGVIIIFIVSLRATIGAQVLIGRKKSAALKRHKQEQGVFEFVRSVAKHHDPSYGQATDPLSWKGTRKFKVVQRIYENDVLDICSFYLTPFDGQPLPSFYPGQFLTIRSELPGHSEKISRCYSLSDSPFQSGYYRITVKKVAAPPWAPADTPPGVFSSHLHNGLAIGDIVEAYAPDGDFRLDLMSNRPLVLIAGGVGLTPMVSMLNTLLDAGSQREVWFFYGVRNRWDHAMRDHLNYLNHIMPNVRIVTAYSRPTIDCRLHLDYDIEGHIDIVLLQHLLGQADYEFYICGPQAMMDTVPHDLRTWGIPKDDIKMESFGVSAPAINTSLTHHEVQDGQSFSVYFAKSGKQIQWFPHHGTLLELAEANNIKTRYNCREGVCGTCKTNITSGDVTYIRNLAKPPEPGSCFPCSAVPANDVVIDL